MKNKKDFPFELSELKECNILSRTLLEKYKENLLIYNNIPEDNKINKFLKIKAYYFLLTMPQHIKKGCDSILELCNEGTHNGVILHKIFGKKYKINDVEHQNYVDMFMKSIRI